MKPSPLTTIAACAGLALATSAPCSQAAPNQTNTTTAADAAKNKTLTGKLVQGDKVIGAKLFNQQGEHIGEINDVLFDENAGGVTHAVLAVGGWAGIGEKLSAVPWKFITASDKNPAEFVVNVEKAKLAGAGNFDRNSWPQMNDEWMGKSYTYYGLTGKSGIKLVRASEADDAELYNQQGEKIGEIDELLLHPQSGKVAYAIADIDDHIGQKDQLTTIPWTLVRQSEKATTGYVVHVDKAKLQKAYSFRENAWPDYSDPAWNHTVHSYYGVDGYWADPIVY